MVRLLVPNATLATAALPRRSARNACISMHDTCNPLLHTGAHGTHPRHAGFTTHWIIYLSSCCRYELSTEFNEALEHSMDRGKNTKIVLKLADVGTQY